VRVVFFGTPAFAVPSLEALIASRHGVVGVVSQPDRPRGRGHQLQPTATKAVALAHGIPVLQPAKVRDPAFLDRIRELRADLGVVVAFGRILPDELLAIPRLGMINVHASILPRYRGAAPIQRAVVNGDAETGVTIMRVESELDAGAMFAVATIPIPPEATSGDMQAVLAPLGARLLVTVVDDLEAGRTVETPQDHTQATFAPKITKDEGTIDWSASAPAVHNLVRGLQPWPLASTRVRGTRLVVRKTRVLPFEQSIAAAPPGTVVRARGDDIAVACGAATFLGLLELQPEGKRTMTAREFLAGRGVAEGARLPS
jgi:methionyl-tRNA formyltransferase